MWGRTLGIYFAVPLAFFAARGYLRPKLLRRLGLFFLAGASQGFVVRTTRRRAQRAEVAQPSAESLVERTQPRSL